MGLVKNENYINIQGWMINELGLKGNSLMVYAIIYGFSQDGNSMFEGSLQYLADWCNSTKQGIQKNLKQLIDMGLITKHEYTRNNQKLCAYSCIPCNKVAYTMQQSCINNIVNNIDSNSNLISKDIKLQDSSESEFQFGKVKPKKPNLYNQCVAAIDDFISNHPDVDRKLLINYLNVCLEGKYLLGINQWCGMLNNTLVQALKNSVSGVTFNDIIQKSIDRAYKTFYPIQYVQGSSTQKSGVSYDVSKSVKVTQEQRERMEKLAAERTRNGEIGYF